jgi:hypothetical protein
MATAGEGDWFPRAIGVVALLLGLGALLDLLFVPPERSEQVFFGYMLTGRTARVATPIHLVFFLWMAWGSFTRRRTMAFVAVGYLVYVIVSLWIWTGLYGTQFSQSLQTTILLNVLASVILLALCRVVFQRRAAFNH